MDINSISRGNFHSKSVLHELPFTEVLSQNVLTRHLSHIGHRDRCYTADLILFAFLSQAIHADKSCQAAVIRVITHALSQGKTPPWANTAAYCKARAQLPEEIIKNITKESGHTLEKEALKQWLWRGRHVKLVDGSTISMPDTQENQKEYPQSKSQEKGLGFPIARIVAIISLATGALLDLAMGCCSGKRTGEYALFREIISAIEAGDILLGDRWDIYSIRTFIRSRRYRL